MQIQEMRNSQSTTQPAIDELATMKHVLNEVEVTYEILQEVLVRLRKEHPNHAIEDYAKMLENYARTTASYATELNQRIEALLLARARAKNMSRK